MSDKKEAIQRLKQISSVGEKRAENLYEQGFESPEDIIKRGLGGLAEVPQIGFQTAKKILDDTKKVVSEEKGVDEEEIGDLVGEMEELEKSLSDEEKEVSDVVDEGEEIEEKDLEKSPQDEVKKEEEAEKKEHKEEKIEDEDPKEPSPQKKEDTSPKTEPETTEEEDIEDEKEIEKEEKEEKDEKEEEAEKKEDKEEKTEDMDEEPSLEKKEDTKKDTEEEEDIKDEVEAIEELQESLKDMSSTEEDEGEPDGREGDLVEEAEDTSVNTGQDQGEVEDESGNLLETIEEESVVGLDFEIAKEVDEWIEDTVGIESHVGEESKCPVCGEIVSIYQDKCDRCGIEFVEGEAKCEDCGASVDVENMRCPECDAALVDEKTKCPICESIVYVSEDVCPACGTEFYEEKIRCDECKSTVPIDSIVCPNCEMILRQKIMEEHLSGKTEISSEKTEVDIGGMNIQMSGGSETFSRKVEEEGEIEVDVSGTRTTVSSRMLFPFPAIVNQEKMKKALLLNAANREIGGVLIEGHRGTAKSVAVRGLSEVLPDIEVIEGCRFSCDPKNPDEWCWECEEQYGDLSSEEIPVKTRPVKVIDLPLNATEDRVVGTLDVEKMMEEGVKAFQEGLLAEVNRGILYVDEINLLDDFIVDVLLDAAAMGRVTVEREEISISYPSNFILVGSMNPEEGALRPQLLDRLALNVKVEGIPDPKERKKIMKRREEFNENPAAFRDEWEKNIENLRENIINAKERVPKVNLPKDMEDIITRIPVDFDVDGHRADIIMKRTAKTNAAFEGRTKVNKDDLILAAEMALPHRMKKGPLEEQEFSVERLKRLVRQYS